MNVLPPSNFHSVTMKILILVIIVVTELSWTRKGTYYKLTQADINLYYSTASSNKCDWIYPSEYAYNNDSVTRAESDSDNCSSCPPGPIPGSGYPEEYIHCDGTQLELADSNFGQGSQYPSTDHYIWPADSDGQLLFMFPTRVSLAAIRLRFYSDSGQGHPRLRFYAVPDDFDVWDAPNISYPHKDVVSVPIRAGDWIVHTSINNLNIKKVLMYKFGYTSVLALSEV